MNNKNLSISFFLILFFLFLTLTTYAQKTSPVKQETALSPVEEGVIKGVNEARSNPQNIVATLEEYKKSFKANMLYLPNRNPLITIEGATAVDDAISDVKKVSKLDILKNSKGLNKAARLQLADLIENTNLGHKGKDGSLLGDRLARFGSVGVSYAENISYKAKDAQSVLMTMIVDDGYKSRSHRKNVFSPAYKLFGIACGTAKDGTELCVAEFADNFVER